jgi:5-carboxymethyl-2-hydroxymuconate isomerase
MEPWHDPPESCRAEFEMPQITIDYSAGVEKDADIGALTEAVHKAAVSSGVFPAGAIRTMARRAEFSCVGDGAANNAFVNITVRIGPGRSADVKKSLTAKFFEAADAQLVGLFAKRPAGLQLELSDFDPSLTMSRNTMITPGG